MKKYLLSVLVCLFFMKVHSQSFTENFNDISLLPSVGWYQQNNSYPLGNNPTWYQGDVTAFTSYNGSSNSYIASNFHSTAIGSGIISNWLLTPNRIFRNGDVFAFYTRKATVGPGETEYPDRLQVRMSTNGGSLNVGATSTDVGDFTTLLLEINPSLLPNIYPQVWTQYTITISGLPAPTSGRLAFRYFVTDAGPTGTNSDYIGIDNVIYTMTNIPDDCPEVTAITVTSPVWCYGGGNGHAFVQPSGGTSFTYQWSHDPAHNSNLATGLSAGTYTCTITNECGNSTTKTIVVTQPPLFEMNLVKDISCQDSTENTFTANPSGGTSPYTYVWSNGAMTNSVFNLPVGEHWVKVTDGKGCELTESFEVIETEPIQITHDDTIATCFNEPVILSPQIIPDLPSGEIINDFTGAFAPGNWQQSSNNSNGSITFNGTNGMTLVGGDNGSATPGYNLITTTVQNNTEISFNWNYSTTDHSTYDYPRIRINGVPFNLQGYNMQGGTSPQSGTHTVSVPAGSTFGIEMYTTDNTAGAATMVLSNFKYAETANELYTYQWTDANNIIVGNQPTYTAYELGTYTLTVTNSIGCSTSKTIEVVWEVEAPQAEFVYFFSDGATLADIPVQGQNLVWINPMDGGTLPETTLLQNQTGYLVTQTIDGCTSMPTQIVAMKDDLVTWTGTEWINGMPSENVHVRILGDLNVGTDTPNFTAAVLFISAEGSVTVSEGHYVAVLGTYINESNLGALGFAVESGGNFFQLYDAPNNIMMGEMTIKRDSNPMKRLDYTLWSSPVVDQNLFGFSPETVNGVTNYQGSTGRIYIYDGANGYVNPTPFNQFTTMKPGTGYLFRAPNNYHATNEVVYEGAFTGIPNNGNIGVATHPMQYNSIGNPYPSNIDADLLFSGNPGIGALYFWNNTGVPGSNYSTCTVGNCVAANGGVNSVEPNGIITVGQGFIVETMNNSVNFTNSMRVPNAGIFSKNDSEKHRIWLNLNNEENQGLNQILVGYISGATNNIDHQIDGKLFETSTSALYNIIDEQNFVIQGRALPFEATDVVQLGFKAAEAGKFNISIDKIEGLFVEGNVKIYLNDKELNIKHNLMESAYTFESAAGESKTRFEIVYKTDDTMNVEEFNSNEVQIYAQNEYIKIDSKNQKIISVELYDLSGRNIHRNENINANNYQIKSYSKGVLLVKVQTQNGEMITKKLITN